MLSIGNNSKTFTALLVGCVLIFSSCESNRWFQSEDTLNAKIQTTWNKIRINPEYDAEQWTFSQGTVVRLKISDQTNDTTVEHGNYSVSTSLSNAYLTITDFPTLDLNAKWEILELSGGVLFIATDHGSGVLQLEFQEK